MREQRKPDETPYWLQVNDENWGPTEIPERRLHADTLPRRESYSSRRCSLFGTVFWTIAAAVFFVLILYVGAALMKVLT